MFYQAEGRAVIQAALPFYRPLLPPHVRGREAELVSELSAACALVDTCTHVANQDASVVCGAAERRNKTDVYQAKVKQMKILSNSTHRCYICHPLERYIINLNF